MIRKFIPHINLVLWIVTLTLFILTKYNPGIISLGFYNVFMYLFFASSFITTVIMIAMNRRLQ